MGRNVILIWLHFIILSVAYYTGNAQSISIDTIVVLDYYTNDSLNNTNLKKAFDAKTSLLNSSHAVINLQGNNSLATVINRGLPSKLFSIFYHGLRLNNINNATYDLNLLPTFYFQNSTFDPSGSLNGNAFNSTAGKIDLQQEKTESNKLEFDHKYGQYSDHELSLFANLSYNKIDLKLGGNIIDNKNQFNFYRNKVKSKSDEMPTEGYNIISDISYNLNQNSKIETGIWFQDITRGLPQIYHRASDQIQDDNNKRYYLNYATTFKNYHLKINSAFAEEELIYKTTTLNSLANTKSTLLTTQIKTPRNWNHGLGLRVDYARTNFFSSAKKRNDVYYSLSKQLNINNTQLTIVTIQHLVDKKLTPLAGELKIINGKYHFDVIRNFNLPGFNDLYWPVGGNVNLKPEKSWQFSTGAIYNVRKSIQAKLNAFSYHISDFIQWLPTDNNYWSPVNVRNIWSRGLELDIDIHKKCNSISIRNNLKYSFTKSTYEDETTSKGKQLIYVPLHKISNNISVSKNEFEVLFNTLLIGKRYETTDNFTYLNPALVFNINVSCKPNFKTFNPIINLGLQNLFNEKYEFVRLFPQPLRRLTLDLKFIFNYKKHNNEIQ